MLLEVKDLEVAYGDYQVVWGVSLGVDAGESVALLGPNGSGKSTVVNTISGLNRAKAGDIVFGGRSLVSTVVSSESRDSDALCGVWASTLRQAFSVSLKACNQCHLQLG